MYCAPHTAEATRAQGVRHAARDFAASLHDETQHVGKDARQEPPSRLHRVRRAPAAPHAQRVQLDLAYSETLAAKVTTAAGPTPYTSCLKDVFLFLLLMP